ncbi:hypothetical protein O181_124296 [Austropuccinia psidii MF-1]|uniref:Uncharacterized protein n=1 Tax=Austropuccinia psidii MF-1 TaxID=1389203 RepID=A0A9Q3KQ70_9BASI|nr:hypothetical protein [Austropuccinia psidii MF-1]
MAPHSSPQGEYSKASLGWIHHPVLPCNFGEAMVLVVLDPPMGPGHKIWAQGASNNPHGPRVRSTAHGPQTAAYGPRPAHHRTPKPKNGQIGPEIQ